MRKIIFIFVCFVVGSMQVYPQKTQRVQQLERERRQLDEDSIRRTEEIAKSIRSARGSVDEVLPYNQRVTKQYYQGGGAPVYKAPFNKVKLKRFLESDGKIIFDALSQEERIYYVGLAHAELEKAKSKKNIATKDIEDKLSKTIKDILGVNITETNARNMLKDDNPTRVDQWLSRKKGLPDREAVNSVIETYKQLVPLYKEKENKVDNSEVGEEVKRLQEINRRLNEWCPDCGKQINGGK